ncbi:MAG: hypothetical protein QQW96_05930 [Tychonema bourrellyi B0820]|nr:hypothetical protein [Tychonema bourrellyi B0820]
MRRNLCVADTAIIVGDFKGRRKKEEGRRKKGNAVTSIDSQLAITDYQIK